TSDWVQYSSGSIKGLLGKYLPAALFEKGGSLIFPSPSYGVIKSPINSAGIQVIDVPLTRSGSCWKFDLAKMAHVIKESRILMQSPAYRRFFMYANVPHNPTGMGYTAIDWRLRIDWAIENDVTLIVDEAYIDLRYNEKLVSVLQVPGWEKCCVVLQSVSKGWNATGLRFGYVIAHPTVIKALRKVMDGKDSGTFAPSIVAGIWCLLHPEITDVTRETYRKRHGALAAGLREVGFDSRMPEAGLCQLTPAPKAAGGAEFASVADCAEWLREKLRISTMAVKADNCSWLRWAVTFRPIPECALETEEAVIGEVTRRLSAAKLVF
ncbi:MAG TPA: aminotransferase class I/II-fold pyridoxal phosphate-dependent enzyme, partial [Candidatus Paceibacterota bacterium]